MQLQVPPQVPPEISNHHLKLEVVTDPAESAKRAGLHYVRDDSPGIQRKRVGRGFSYFDVKGNRIRDRAQIERLKALVIPPAWRDVWICPSPKGHLQATGYDEKDRKQYRYHPDWRKVRDQVKFNRMIPFGQMLPVIRQETEAHLRRRGLPREKVLATVVRLLEATLIRVGNDQYAKENQSFGLTTMRDRHVEVSTTKVQFEFRGKRGIKHDIELSDRRLARIVKQCRDIPGYELFQYFDDNGDRQTVDSGEVNAYLQSITGEEFTAKDFRTWAGTVQTALALEELGSPESETATKKNVTQAIKVVAKQLGNRAATCRKYYVHPEIIQAYQDGTLLPTLEKRHDQKFESDSGHLRPEEYAVLLVLQERLAQSEQHAEN